MGEEDELSSSFEGMSTSRKKLMMAKQQDDSMLVLEQLFLLLSLGQALRPEMRRGQSHCSAALKAGQAPRWTVQAAR